MNFIQAYYELPLAIVYKEEKTDLFIDFMQDQYKKFLLSEINQFKQDMKKTLLPKKSRRKGKGFSLFY